jgi:hypothetical protein
MRILRFAVLAATACLLTACFDMDQKISINSDGSGTYEMAISAEGPIGDALKKDTKDSNNMFGSQGKESTTVKGDKVTKSVHRDFRSLNDIALKDEEVSIHYLHPTWWGWGPTHLRFLRVFNIDASRTGQSGGPDPNDPQAKAAMAAIFAGHTYAFTLTLPGSIESAQPLNVNGTEVKPEINGGTIVWRMPLSTLMGAKKLVFDVEFSSSSVVPDAKTQHAKS